MKTFRFRSSFVDEKARSPTKDWFRHQQSREQGNLCVNGVSKKYFLRGRNVLAIDNVSFTVNRGEVCVLLGPSGCGKSTLLRMVAGLLPATSGDIALSEKLIFGPSRERGMVFQSYTSFPWLTVQQNVEYGLSISGCSRKERREIANHFIERVKLTRFKTAYPNQLSGGMRQRVAIARTLANGPKILLMDEPFGALDAETRWQMQELLLEVIKQESMTTLMVTHDIEEALFLADKIIFLSRHPGTVRECIFPSSQTASKPRNREEMFDDAHYVDLEKRIIRMMREEANNAVKYESDLT